MLITFSFTTYDGTGRTGLSPTINVYDLSDDSKIVNAAAVNEVAEGGYDYNFSAYDPTKKYYWIVDSGSGVPRYRRGWISGGAIPDYQAGTSGGLPTVDGNNYTAGIQGTKNTLDDLTDISAAEVNAEVLDVMNVDTFGEPGQGTPPAATSIFAKINYLYKRWRNKYTETSGQANVYNDAGTVIDQKCTLSDDGTTFTEGEYESGP